MIINMLPIHTCISLVLTLSARSTVAPDESSSLTKSVLPLLAAHESGVCPSYKSESILLILSGHACCSVWCISGLMDFCGHVCMLNCFSLLCAEPPCPHASYCICTHSVSCFLLPFDVRTITISCQKNLLQYWSQVNLLYIAICE